MIRRLILFSSLAILTLAGCGGGTKKTATSTPFEAVPVKRSPSTVARCLNDRSFLVQATPHRVSGSSPGGINFSVTFFQSSAAARVAQATHHYLTQIVSATSNVGIDDSGNPPAKPGGPPRALAGIDLHTIVVCILHG